ncbi:ABC-2 type transport system permease protein [Sphingomonas vulcanisoli]|uniref:ABC-2 type transport system permease protein n=1 Tax=Sphingomonas vulcanisoli TaxID=1658060 RepID=A0ABX0TTW5_9SPHN|nr:ABC transporter permease [Sphingomonas vulcanisoli]NIJ08174.1 ABC-2 type transport system permease protein [Sphingomonas vulcanisoli]
MMRTLRSALVIARRDYIATVWSKTFLIFLIGPLLPLIFGAVASMLADGGDQGKRRDAVALTMPADDAAAVMNARAKLDDRLGDQIPLLERHAPAPGQAALGGTLDRPRLDGPPQALHDLGGPIGLILDTARADRALGGTPPAPVDLNTAAIQPPPDDHDRSDVGKVAQFILFFLTFLIASMLVSNLVEEKANKIIELLASAVPIDAIFLGKLIAMLGATLTGVVVWASCAAIGIEAFVPAGAIPTPAIGWPIFLGLGLVYFVMLFLLWGVLYLGVGAQAGSAREAQTLAMPLSLGQALVFTFASAQASHPDRPIALIAAIIPWSSPFAMMARAAILPALWPHLAALALQFVTLLIAIKLGARLFRTNILKTGRPARQPNRFARLFRR